MSVAHELVKAILSCSNIVYYSDNIERKTLDGKRILAPFLGIIGTNGVESIFLIRDDGVSCTNLVMYQVAQSDLPEGLRSFDIYKPSAQFDGPVYETYETYRVDDGFVRGFSSVEVFDHGKSCKLSISEDAPTLFEIAVS